MSSRPFRRASGGVIARRADVTERAAAKSSQARLAGAVAGARHVRRAGSGHEIHNDQPRRVIDSIRDVLDAVRAGRTELAP